MDVGPQSVGNKKRKKTNAGFPTRILLLRFRALSCFDQRYITFHASKAILNSFSNYMTDR